MKVTALFLLLIFNISAVSQSKLPKRIKPSDSFRLDKQILPEGSGLAAWNDHLFVHNDSDDINLYKIDTLGNIVGSDQLKKTVNHDWEDMTSDAGFFYIGDIGNNIGTRDTLNIIRLNKSQLLDKKITIDTISFNWPKVDTNGNAINDNPDCEAMISVGDSLYLFTKEFKTNRQTRLFAISRHPGHHIAKYKATLETKVLVTGATFDRNKKRLVLCGYNLWLQPYLLVFPNVAGTDFLNGKYQKIKVRLPLRQIEAIDSFDGKTFYLINEHFSFFLKIFNRRPGLHRLSIPE